MLSVCVDEHLRLRLVGLSSAGHGVADARASRRIHRLHDDKGPLLQRGHRQVPVVRHRLQVRAVPRPHGVPHLQDSHLVVAHLKAPAWISELSNNLIMVKLLDSIKKHYNGTNTAIKTVNKYQLIIRI